MKVHSTMSKVKTVFHIHSENPQSTVSKNAINTAVSQHTKVVSVHEYTLSDQITLTEVTVLIPEQLGSAEVEKQRLGTIETARSVVVEEIQQAYST